MTKDTNLKLNMTFEEALERFAPVNIKDISEVEEVFIFQTFKGE